MSFFTHNGELFVGQRNGMQANLKVDAYLQSLLAPSAAAPGSEAVLLFSALRGVFLTLGDALSGCFR